jgi:transposase-like protein
MENRKRTESLADSIKGQTWNEDDARRVLDEQVASGETITAFARRHGLVPQRLWWWKKRLGPPAPPRRAQDMSSPLAATFLPVTVRAAEPQACPASLKLGGGVRVQLRTLDATSAGWVACLVQALAGVS